MNVSSQQSYFTHRSRRPRLTNQKAFFRRNVAAIIELCKKTAKNLKKRNQYESLLFPYSHQEEPSLDISQDLLSTYPKEAQYPFYLSRCNLFIDNYHLKLMRKREPIPFQFDSLNYGTFVAFAEWIGSPQTDFIVGVTDRDWVLVASVEGRKFSKFCISGGSEGSANKKIVSLSGFDNLLFVFTLDQYYVLEYRNGSRLLSKVKMVLSRTIRDKAISKGFGFKSRDQLFIFITCGRHAFIEQPSPKLLQLDLNRITLFENQQPILNFRLSLKNELVTVVVADKLGAILVTFHLKTQQIRRICRKQNPYDFWSESKLNFIPFLSFIQRDNYLLCCLAFRYQLFFIKIEESVVSCSKRVKFPAPLEALYPLGNGTGIIMVLVHKVEGGKKREFILTHENKIVSFQQYVNLAAIDKYSLELETPFFQNKSQIRQELFLFNDQEIFVLEKNQIHPVSVSSWEQIYNDMCLTQNIKLLKFLVLLNLTYSPLLEKPSSFANLESFFPIHSAESQQILLEYYFLINSEPKNINILDLNIMLPFILHHKISNLSPQQQQQLLSACLHQDERLVEEMIIGGAECGWEYAVKNGWVRAFKVMVERGMEPEMPILKLYSLALFHNNKYFKPVNEGVSNRYLSLMIEYIMFILEVYVVDLIESGDLGEFKIIFHLIFREDIWNYMMSYLPESAVRIIRALFLHNQILTEINSYGPKDLSMFSESFSALVNNQNRTNCQVVFYHLCETYLKANPNHPQLLFEQQCKILLLKFYQYQQSHGFSSDCEGKMLKIIGMFNGSEGQKQIICNEIAKYAKERTGQFLFSFGKVHLKLLLMRLIANDSRCFREGCRQLNQYKFGGKRGEGLVAEESSDFLVYLWFDIFTLIIVDAFRESGDQFRLKVKQEVRLLLSDIEQENYKERYLILHLMMSINSENEYTVKIFHRFLKCEYSKLRSKVFSFLRRKLPECQSLQEEFIKKLKEVIEIDKEQCREILETFFEGREKEIISKIDDDPALQLEFVELIIKEGVSPIENYYTNLHVQLLLKLKPKDFIFTLKKNSQYLQYDIPEALKIVTAKEDFKEKDEILIYLFETAGEVDKAISTYFRVIERLILEYVQLTEGALIDLTDNHKDIIKDNSILNSWISVSRCLPNGSELIEELVNKFEDLINLIYRQFQVKYEYHQICLSHLSRMLLDVSSQNHHYKDEYMLLISNLFGTYLIRMFEHNSLHNFSLWITQHQGKLECSTSLFQYLAQVYNKIIVQISTLKSMVSMERTILLNQIRKTLALMEFCVSSSSFCHICLCNFSKQQHLYQCLLFSCGHLYHKHCVDPINGQYFCYFCVSNNQYESMVNNSTLNLIELLKSYREKKAKMRGSSQVKIKIKQTLMSVGEKRKNRLKLFDKLATSIQTQADILDLKMTIQDYYKGQIKK